MFKPHHKHGTWGRPVKCRNPQHPERLVKACDALKADFNTRDNAFYGEDQRLTGELPLPKGRTLLHDVRDPDNVHNMGFRCRGCGKVKFTDYSNVHRYIKGEQLWNELCSECIKSRGSLARNTEDKKSGSSDTVTLFSLESDRGVPVFAADCQHIWHTTRVNATNNWDIYIEICPNCQRNARAFRDRLKELGRLEAKDLKPEELLEYVNAVVVVWRRERNPNLPYEEQLSRVTQVKVAKELNLGGATDPGKKLNGRLKSRKVDEMFPGVDKWFPLFIKAVVDTFEKSETPESIACGLIFRPRLARALATYTPDALSGVELPTANGGVTGHASAASMTAT